MANRSRDGMVPASQSYRTEQLRRVSVELETVLESMDLERETELADEVVEAIKATDRAYELETDEEEVTEDTGNFMFPMS